MGDQLALGQSPVGISVKPAKHGRAPLLDRLDPHLPRQRALRPHLLHPGLVGADAGALLDLECGLVHLDASVAYDVAEDVVAGGLRPGGRRGTFRGAAVLAYCVYLSCVLAPSCLPLKPPLFLAPSRFVSWDQFFHTTRRD